MPSPSPVNPNFSSVVAFMALNVAAGKLTVAKNMSFCNMTTVLSLFAGVIFLHEPFNAASLVASVLIILGVVLAGRRKKAKG